MFVQSDGWDFKECHSHLVLIGNPQCNQAGFRLHCICVHTYADRRWKKYFKHLKLKIVFSNELFGPKLHSWDSIVGRKHRLRKLCFGSVSDVRIRTSRIWILAARIRIQLHLYFLVLEVKWLNSESPIFSWIRIRIKLLKIWICLQIHL